MKSWFLKIFFKILSLIDSCSTVLRIFERARFFRFSLTKIDTKKEMSGLSIQNKSEKEKKVKEEEDGAFVMKNLKPISKKQAIQRALYLEKKTEIRLQCTAQPNLAKYTDLCEAHRQIAEQYVIAQEWESAAMHLVKTAKYYVSLHLDGIAANYFEDAATCLFVREIV